MDHKSADENFSVGISNKGLYWELHIKLFTYNNIRNNQLTQQIFCFLIGISLLIYEHGSILAVARFWQQI